MNAAHADLATGTHLPHVCATCGRSFAKAPGLGAHRYFAHGIGGTSEASKTLRRRRERESATPGKSRSALEAFSKIGPILVPLSERDRLRVLEAINILYGGES